MTGYQNRALFVIVMVVLLLALDFRFQLSTRIKLAWDLSGGFNDEARADDEIEHLLVTGKLPRRQK